MHSTEQLLQIGKEIRESADGYRKDWRYLLQGTIVGSQATPHGVIAGETMLPCSFDFYPYLLHTAFPIDESQIRTFAIAANLHADFISILNSLANRQFEDCHSLGWSSILYAAYEQEKALMLWRSLFSDSSRFWDYLDRYFAEYAAGVLEDSRHTEHLAEYSAPEFARVAQGKLAMTRIVPTGLALLAGMEHKIEPIVHSLDEMAQAFELYAGVKHWRSDYDGNRWSYVLSSLLERTGCMQQVNLGAKPAIDQIGAHMYLGGFAEQVLEEAEARCVDARRALSDVDCPDWCVALRGLQKACRKLRTDLRDLKDQTLMKRARQQRGSVQSVSEDRRARTLDQTIEAGLGYVLDCQLPDGHWSDWAISIGSSREFATAYVGRRLQQVMRSGFSDSQLTTALERATTWLLSKQQASGGWGWHSEIAADAESTANALMFLAPKVSCYPDTLAAGMNYLCRLMGEDGGVSTYRIEDIANQVKLGNPWYPQVPLEKYGGWVTEDACITAISAYALCLVNIQGQEAFVRKMRTYVERMQSSAGFWEAYWWSGRMFGTEAALQALEDARQFGRSRRRARRWLVDAQNKDGSWSQTGEGDGTPVNTALGLSAVLSVKAEAESADAATWWLCDTQRRDGSWDSEALMRVPDPSASPSLRQAKANIAIDQERLFTSATVIAALAKRFADR